MSLYRCCVVLLNFYPFGFPSIRSVLKNDFILLNFPPAAQQNEGNFYKVTKGWGVQKEDGRIHTFDYSVSPALGRTQRIFATGLEDAAEAVGTAIKAQEKSVGIDGAEADAKVVVQSARKKLEALIFAAWVDLVAGNPKDVVSYAYLSEKALLVINDDVKALLKKHDMLNAGVSLGLVTDLGATSSPTTVKKKAIKKRMNNQASISNETVMYMNDLYLSSFYRKLVPKVQLEATMEEVGINAGPDTTWSVSLTEQAPNLEKFRSLDLDEVKNLVAKAPKADQDKMLSIFAGVTGGGENVPIARKNMVAAGIPIEFAFKLEKEAKEVRKRANDDLQSTFTKDCTHARISSSILGGR